VGTCDWGGVVSTRIPELLVGMEGGGTVGCCTLHQPALFNNEAYLRLSGLKLSIQPCPCSYGVSRAPQSRVGLGGLVPGCRLGLELPCGFPSHLGLACWNKTKCLQGLSLGFEQYLFYQYSTGKNL
jgi:hypothetical protein